MKIKSKFVLDFLREQVKEANKKARESEADSTDGIKAYAAANAKMEMSAGLIEAMEGLLDKKIKKLESND